MILEGTILSGTFCWSNSGFGGKRYFTIDFEPGNSVEETIADQLDLSEKTTIHTIEIITQLKKQDSTQKKISLLCQYHWSKSGFCGSDSITIAIKPESLITAKKIYDAIKEQHSTAMTDYIISNVIS
jgi:hypothetical protein